MRNATRTTGLMVGCALLLSANAGWAQDWPQWRGPNRNAVAKGFTAPRTWPRELTEKWMVSVGDGVATPALVGDKLYVFGRQDGNEVLRCLDAATGKEVWQDKYETGAVTGAASGFGGPRSSPTVADGKVVTLGVRGVLSCLDAASGKVLWRKDTKGWPRFFTSSSPMVVDGTCIAQVGTQNAGAITAYDLAAGNEKWTWTGDGTAYASPELLTLDGAKAIVAETAQNIVGLSAADGKLLWKIPFAVRYNACTPIIEGATVIYSGSGNATKAVRIEKKGDSLAAKELWSNTEHTVQFNTPVLKNGFLFGISDRDSLFCLDAQTGKTAWSSALTNPNRRSRGYGSVVDAGTVLMALTPGGQLIVYEPSGKEFKQTASYKVAQGNTFAYPVVAGKRVFVKDRDSVRLYTIE